MKWHKMGFFYRPTCLVLVLLFVFVVFLFYRTRLCSDFILMFPTTAPAVWPPAGKLTALFPPADDMEAIPVKHFVKHIMELYKNNMQGFSEEFEVRPSRNYSNNQKKLFYTKLGTREIQSVHFFKKHRPWDLIIWVKFLPTFRIRKSTGDTLQSQTQVRVLVRVDEQSGLNGPIRAQDSTLRGLNFPPPPIDGGGERGPTVPGRKASL